MNPIDLTHLHKELCHLIPPKIAKNNTYSSKFDNLHFNKFFKILNSNLKF